MALPFLPGNTFNKTLGLTRFHKSHHMDTIHDFPLEVGMHKPGIGGERRLFQWKKPTTSFIPRGEPSFKCGVDLSKKVLSFSGYFQEAVTEMREGTFRMRKVKIYFFLEDDTMMVVEARMKNSSLNQGVLVKRQRIPRPGNTGKQFYTVEDLNLGTEINIFGRVYKICNCDEFTGEFYKKLGIILYPPQPIPTVLKEKELFEEKNGRKLRAQNVDHMNALQFFQRDPLVLRFFCFWDDRHNAYGDLHQLMLHYFLADDTIELVEILPPNSGRDSIPCFLRRTRTPKEVTPMKRIGEEAKHSVLNVLNDGEWDYRYLLDPLEVWDGKKTGRVVDDYYTDCDLKIGAALNIFNKKVVIYDMDEFTKNFYRDKYGLTDFTPAECPLPTEMKKAACKYNKQLEYGGCGGGGDGGEKREIEGGESGEGEGKREIDPNCLLKNRFLDRVKAYEKQWCYLPPYNGFGGEKDSIGNCLSLHPEQNSTKNLIKFLIHDRKGLDSNILRFNVSLLSTYPADKERIFILNFYRTDDTLEIHEIKISGFIGGVFSSRRRIPKPCQERFPVGLTQYYGDTDLILGNTIIVNGHSFLFVSADEYALNYMEARPKEFPQSDWRLTLQKLKPIPANIDVKKLIEGHRAEANMPYEVFKRVLNEADQVARGDKGVCCLKEHDFITLARHYKVPTSESYDLNCRLERVRSELKRLNFEDFDSLCYQSAHHDKKNSGFLPKKTLLTVFKAHKLPVPHSLLEEIIDHMGGSDDSVKYCNVINAINWRINQADPEIKCGTVVRCDDMRVNFERLYENLIDLVYH